MGDGNGDAASIKRGHGFPVSFLPIPWYTGQFFHAHLAPEMQHIDTLLAAGNASATAL